MKYFGASILQQLLARDLENHRASLKSRTEKELEEVRSALHKELEEFRSKLQLESFKHQETFTHLQRKRAEVIEELYKKLSNAHIAIFLALGKEDKVPFKVAILHARTLSIDFSKYCLEHSIYLDKAFSKQVEKLALEFIQICSDSRYSEIAPASFSGAERQAFEEYSQKILLDTALARNKIETSFRDMLGISTE